MLARLKEKIQNNPRLKKRLLHLIMHPVKTRPRWWVRQLQFLYLKKGKGSVIYRSVRKDLPPFNSFVMGNYSVIEDYSCLNNSVGDIIIGHHCRIGLSNTIIGPVQIDEGVNISQHVVITALDHVYQDITKGLIEQGVTTSPIHIGEHTVIGANSVILSGVNIGKHCFIGAGSLVNKDVPDYTIAVGNPLRFVKHFDFEQKQWIKIKTEG